MGAQGSVVDPDDFEKLEKDVTSIRGQVSGLNALKDKVDDISKAAVSALDYKKLAESLALATNYTETLAKAIAKNPNELSVPLALEISKTSAALEALNQNLSKNTVFQDKVADTLSSNPAYKARIKGEQGAAGNIGEKAAIQSNLYDTGYMMWCADGELCKLPNGKSGIDFGKGESKIWDDGQLRIRTDDNLYFHIGNKEALHIDSNRVKTDRLDIGGWTIQEEGDHLVFKRGNAQQGAGNQAHLRMAADGNFWLSRSTGPGWVADNMMRTDRDYGIKVAGNGQWADMGKTHSDKNYHWVKVKFESF